MLEKLLQKIINDFLGDYIEEIDDKKVKIAYWSGTIQIQNVKLQKNILKDIDLPIIIKDSQLIELKIKIPWKKLFTQPLIIEIDTVFLLIELANQQKTTSICYQQVFNKIKKNVHRIVQQIVKEKNKKVSDGESLGYLDKIYLKMLDNLYLSIKNFHINFKPSKNITSVGNFSCGLTLERIELFAVNQNGQQIFIDRQKMQEGQIKSLTKKLIVGNFGFYWNENIKESEDQIRLKMMQKSKLNYLFLFNLNGIIKEHMKQEKKQFEIKLLIQPIKIKLTNIILSQFYYLLTIIKQTNDELKRIERLKQNEISERNKDILGRFCAWQLNKNKKKVEWNEEKQMYQITTKYSYQSLNQFQQNFIKNHLNSKQIQTLINIQNGKNQIKKTIQDQIKKNQNLSQLNFSISVEVSEIDLSYSNENQNVVDMSLYQIQFTYHSYEQYTTMFLNVSKIEGFGVDNQPLIWIFDRDSEFFNMKIESRERRKFINFNFGKIAILYDIKTLYQLDKIRDISLDFEIKHKALDKIDLYSRNLEKSFSQTSFQSFIYFPALQMIVQIGKQEWLLKLNNIQMKKNDVNQLKIQEMSLKYLQTQLIQPFSLKFIYQNSNFDCSIKKIALQMKKIHYLSLQNLKEALITFRKNDLIKKSKIYGIIFFKKSVWKKCQAALVRDKLYIWENQNQYPIAKIRVRTFYTKCTVQSLIVYVGDLKNEFKMMIENEESLQNWKKHLQDISDVNSIHEEKYSFQDQKSPQKQYKLKIEIEDFGLTLLDEFKLELNLKDVYFLQQKTEKLLKIYDVAVLYNEENQVIKKSFQNLIYLRILKEKTQIFVSDLKFLLRPEAIIKVQKYLFTDFNNQYYQVKTVKNFQTVRKQLISQITIQTKSIEIEGWHMKANIPFLLLEVDEFSLFVNGYSNLFEIIGEIKGLSLFDLSGYPKVEKDSFQKQKIVLNQTENCLFFKYQKNLCLSIKQQGYKILKITLKNFNFMYLHEVVLRIIDWANIQLLGSILTPDYFWEVSQNEGLREKKIKKLGKEKIYEMIFEEKPLLLSVNLINSKINFIESTQNYETVSPIYLFCSQANISSSIQKQYQIMLENYIYSDVFLLKFKQIVVFYEQKQLSNKINLDINIKLFNKESQYLFLYPQGFKELCLSKNEPNFLDLAFQFSPSNLKLHPLVFQSLNKMIQHNFLYENGMSWIFIYEDRKNIFIKKILLKFFLQHIQISIFHQNQHLSLPITGLSCQLSFLDQEYEFNFLFKNVELMFKQQKILVTKNIPVNFIQKFNQINEGEEPVFLVKIKKFEKINKKVFILKNFFIFFSLQLIEFGKTFFQHFFSKKQKQQKKLGKSAVFIRVPNSPNKKISSEIKSNELINKSEQKKDDFEIYLSQNMFTFQIENYSKTLGVSFNFALKNNDIRISDAQIHFLSKKEGKYEKKRCILRETSVNYTKSERSWKLQMSKMFFKLSLKDLLQVKNIASIYLPSVVKLLENKNEEDFEFVELQQNEINETYHLKFNIIQILILTENSFPLIYTNLLINDHNSFDKLVECYTNIDYFNKRINVYEPLLQKTKLAFSYEPNLSLFLPPEFIGGQKNTFIGINISTNFLENFIPSWYEKDKKNQIKEQSLKEVSDDVNCWIITNELGDELICHSLKSNQFIEIQAGKSEKLSFIKQSQEYIMNFPSKNDAQIGITIGKKLRIKKIDLTQNGIKKLIFTYEGMTCWIYKSLFVDIGKNIKYVKFYTQFQIKNKTNRSISIQAQQQIQINPFSSYYLPFNFQKNSVLLNSQPITAISNSISISNELFLLLKKYQQMRTQFTFLPPSQIVNKLPFPVSIAGKKFNSENMLFAYTLNPSEQEFMYTSLLDLQINVYVEFQNYQWTDFLKVENCIIQLKDHDSNKMRIKTQIKKLEGMDTMIISPIVVFKNETKYAIRIHDENSIIEIEGDKQCCVANFKLLFLSFKPLNLPYKIKISSQITEFKVEIPNTTFIEEFIIEAKLISSHFGEFKQIKIFPKYIFHNQTEFTVFVKKPHHKYHNTRTIPDHTALGFQFLPEDFQKKHMNYHFTINDPPNFEWSGQISFNKKGNNHFVLRNRFDNKKMLHFNLIIKNVGSRWFLTLKKIEKPPYLIVNKLKEVRIKVIEYNIWLDRDEQVGYSWQSPIKDSEIPILLKEKEGFDDKMIEYKIKVNPLKEEDSISLKKDKKGSIKLTTKQTIQSLEFQFKYFSLEKSFLDISKIKSNSEEAKSIEIDLPLQIGIINNSVSPVYHLVDLTFNMFFVISSNLSFDLKFNNLQIDNQMINHPYFPVILQTSLSMNASLNLSMNWETEIFLEPTTLKLEEQFIRGFSQTFVQVSKIMENEKSSAKSEEENQLFIAKVKLPKIVLFLHIQTNKLSIETKINLDQPSATKYPWDEIPYPVEDIIINILSHLSISPLTFVESFQKGFAKLLTEEASYKGVQGFFGQIIGAISNSVSGVLGIIVGHDIERVDNFVDGCEKGTGLLMKEIGSIKDQFQPSEYSIQAITKSIGSGLLSIVYKPVKGLLRMTLKISQGVKKTALFVFEQTAFKYRNSIVFYGSEELFKPYSSSESSLLHLLKHIKGDLKYFYLIKFYIIEQKLKNQSLVVAVGADQIITFSRKTNQIKWAIKLEELHNIKTINFCTLEFHEKKSKNQQNQVIQLMLNHQQQANELRELAISLSKKAFIQL